MKEGDTKDLILLPAVMVGAGGLGLAAAEATLRIWGGLPSWYPTALAGAVGAVPAWMITGICFKQKHTYNAQIYKGNPGCLVPAWLFFFSMIGVMTGAALGGPSVFVMGGLAAVGTGKASWVLGAALLAGGLVALAVSVSALSRGLLLWATQRQVEILPTSPARGAAAGLVELRGKARGLGGEEGMLFGQTPGDNRPARPFALEDPTGRVRVEPPPVSVWEDPRFAIKRHAHYGLPVLESGDEVLVLGELRDDPSRPGERTVVPWTPAWASFGTRLLSRPSIFLLASEDEGRAKRKLFRARLGWLALGGLLTAGSLLTVVVAAAGLLRSSWLSVFAVFTR